jgi:hypothetical protein
MAEKYRMLSERMQRGEAPFMATFVWTLVPALIGTVLAYMAPERSVLLFAGIPAAVGLAIGLYTDMSSSPLAGVFRFPVMIVGYVIHEVGGGK